MKMDCCARIQIMSALTIKRRSHWRPLSCAHIYLFKRKTIGKNVSSFDSCISTHMYTTAPLRIGNVLWCTCFLVLRGDRTCARVRVSFHGMRYRCVSRGDPSTHSNGLQSPDLLRQLSAHRRVSRPATSSSSSFSAWPIAHVDPVRARTHTAVIWRTWENGSRTRIETKLTSACDLYRAATIPKLKAAFGKGGPHCEPWPLK